MIGDHRQAISTKQLLARPVGGSSGPEIIGRRGAGRRQTKSDHFTLGGGEGRGAAVGGGGGVVGGGRRPTALDGVQNGGQSKKPYK